MTDDTTPALRADSLTEAVAQHVRRQMEIEAELVACYQREIDLTEEIRRRDDEIGRLRTMLNVVGHDPDGAS